MVSSGCPISLNLAVKLAVIGLLQSGGAEQITDVQTDVGLLVYDGYAPTVTIEVVEFALVVPDTGEIIYTGYTPSINENPPFPINFTSKLFSAGANTPWRVSYQIYDSSNNFLGIYSPGLAGGVVTNEYSLSFTSGIPDHIEIQVQRQNEGFPTFDNRTNYSGNILVYKNLVLQSTFAFPASAHVNKFFTVNAISSDDEIEVDIHEGL